MTDRRELSTVIGQQSWWRAKTTLRVVRARDERPPGARGLGRTRCGGGCGVGLKGAVVSAKDDDVSTGATGGSEARYEVAANIVSGDERAPRARVALESRRRGLSRTLLRR
ncbi:hypothetical protein [Haladaptatus sp. NG-SE-30]